MNLICSLDVPIQVQLRYDSIERSPGQIAIGLLSATLNKRHQTVSDDGSTNTLIWYITSVQWHTQLNLALENSSPNKHINDCQYWTDLESEFLQKLYIRQEFVREHPQYIRQLGPNISKTETLTFRIYFPSNETITRLSQAMAIIASHQRLSLKFRLVLSFTSNELLVSSEIIDPLSSSLLTYAYDISIDLACLYPREK